MKTILLSTGYPGKPREIVESLVPDGYDLIMLDSVSQEEFDSKAHLADYILASGNLKVSRKLLDSAPKLKMVQRAGVGLDSLDLPALKEKNIPVYVNKGVNSDSVAEHSVMFILAALRRLPVINNATKNGIWKKQEQGVTTRELSTQTVGLVGSGNIGRTVARMLGGFRCKVLYYDVFRLSAEQEAELGIEYCELDELFSRSDVISLHCPLTEDTNELICAENIAKMKDGAIIVNTSRGKLINESDLIAALDSGRLGFAAVDVYCDEPLKNTALASHEKVICTPHIAGNTYDSFSRMIEYAIRNIVCFDEGRYDEIEEHKLNY